MANETDTTGKASQIATELIARVALRAHLAKAIFLKLVHFDDELNGARAAKKDYPVRADLGAGAAGPGEGIAHAANIEVTMGTAISVTPSEAFSSLSVISYDAIQQTLGVNSAVLDRMIDEDSTEMWVRALSGDVASLVARGVQKAEADMLAELSNVTASVGTTTADVTITNLLTAIYTSNTLQPTRPVTERRYMLTPNQVHEINLEALATSGGLNGIWQGKDSSFTNNNPDMGAGYEGSFLGYATHAYDHELRITANAAADVVGVFGALGVPGLAPDAPQLAGAAGAFVFAERSPLSVKARYDIDKRAVLANCNWRYGTALSDDSNAVAIVTDAP